MITSFISLFAAALVMSRSHMQSGGGAMSGSSCIRGTYLQLPPKLLSACALPLWALHGLRGLLLLLVFSTQAHIPLPRRMQLLPENFVGILQLCEHSSLSLSPRPTSGLILTLPWP